MKRIKNPITEFKSVKLDSIVMDILPGRTAPAFHFHYQPRTSLFTHRDSESRQAQLEPQEKESL